MIGGKQQVNLSSGCHTVGIAAHEFGKCFYSPAVKDKVFVAELSRAPSERAVEHHG